MSKINEDEIKIAKNDLISLYVNIKKGINKEINSSNKNNYKNEEIITKEAKIFSNLSLSKLINYIKLSLDELISTKVEEEIKLLKKEINDISENQNLSWKYEELLIKEEAAIREHISNEHRLKLECERLKEIIIECEFEKNKMDKKLVI